MLFKVSPERGETGKDKHVQQSPITGLIFLDDDILLWFLYSFLVNRGGGGGGGLKK
jgi:hypothetical protein